MHYMGTRVFVVIPNFNGAGDLPGAMRAVLAQSYKDLTLVVVDNGSSDDSRAIIASFERKDRRVRGLYLAKNYGFTGGMNPGLALALQEGANYVAGCNNDALPHKDWLKHLVAFLDTHKTYGVAACKLLHADGKTFDSTGDQYSIWGLSYPRGRDEAAGEQYDAQTTIFGASGGASLYRTSMLANIGLFDQDFFAYYEDIDLSFRAQLAGYKIGFVPQSLVYHERGNTSARMPSGFTTYQTMKNLPFVLWKDLPAACLWRVLPRFTLAYGLFFVRALQKGRGWPALKGWLVSCVLLPKKLVQRWHIQRRRTVSSEYIWSIMLHDLPPNAQRLRAMRSGWHRLTRRKAGA